VRRIYVRTIFNNQEGVAGNPVVVQVGQLEPNGQVVQGVGSDEVSVTFAGPEGGVLPCSQLFDLSSIDIRLSYCIKPQ
jgi:hypothetical protein